MGEKAEDKKMGVATPEVATGLAVGAGSAAAGSIGWGTYILNDEMIGKLHELLYDVNSQVSPHIRDKIHQRLPILEKAWKKWEAATGVKGTFKRPFIAFSAMPTSIKIGVTVSATTLGFGVAWVVNKWRDSDRDTSHDR